LVKLKLPLESKDLVQFIRASERASANDNPRSASIVQDGSDLRQGKTA
jgi:hypothetical protein